MDLIATATPQQFSNALALVAGDPSVDAVIVIFIPPLNVTTQAVAHAVPESVAGMSGAKPVLAVFMDSHGQPAELTTGPLRIPCYPFPEEAAQALAHTARYAESRSRPLSQPLRPAGIRSDEASALIAGALGRRNHGRPRSPQGRRSRLVHKTDVGGVRLGLSGSREGGRAAREMGARFKSMNQPLTGFLVQQMAGQGSEMLIGAVQDPQFGPIVACAAGGVAVELLGDVAFRLAPLSSQDAEEMVHGLRTFPLLTGFRGAPPRDVTALEDLLLRVSALTTDLPAVAEIECNPVIVQERGVLVVDARVRIGDAVIKNF